MCVLQVGCLCVKVLGVGLKVEVVKRSAMMKWFRVWSGVKGSEGWKSLRGVRGGACMFIEDISNRCVKL